MRNAESGHYLLRSWIIIVLGIVLIALLLDSLLVARSRNNLESELRDSYAPLFSLLQGSLQPLPETSRNEWLAGHSAGWELPVQLIPLDDFAGDEALHAELAGGAIQVYATSDREPVLYQRLAGSEAVLALGPLPPPRGRLFETLVISAYYALVALLVLLWIRPFYRDLGVLRRAAASFGRADFSARVELDEKSSILPVAQSFNAMADRIEYLISAHRELTHAVSHELRTPLARFRFSLDLLSRNTDPERKQHYLDNMKADINELETLIDELLSYARLSEENLLTNLVDMDLRGWLQRELETYAEESISISCSYNSSREHSSCRCSFNPDLLGRAIHNIIRNGLRYARSSINIQVQCSAETVELRICDDGPGIPEEFRLHIFEPFARGETSRDRSSGGYGLGLAIAARIVQRHRGSIRVENCKPGGACFILRWPT